MSVMGPPPNSQYTPLPMSGPPPFPYSVPARMVMLDQNPYLHCNARQVKRQLLGQDLSIFQDPDGSLKSFETELLPDLMQEVTDEVVRRLGTPFDWCFIVDFFDGTGSNTLVLPYRNIADVTTCVIRVLPSNVWYHFVRPRRLDGSEFVQLIGQEIINPPSPPVAGGTEPLPPGPPVYPINIVEAATIQGPIYPTGIEDADMLVDTRRRMIQIPPRVLYANLSTPLWNYTFFPGVKNIEVHTFFGFAPKTYLSGAALAFNTDSTSPQYGVVLNPNPADANDPIDWSSGMPTGLTVNVAKLVANRILRLQWRAISGGLSSISVDGASQSFGGKAYGEDLNDETEAIWNKLLSTYGVPMVL